MEPSKQIKAVAQTYLQEQQLKQQAEYIAVLENTIAAIANEIGVEPQQLISEVTSQLTGKMLAGATEKHRETEALHGRRGARYAQAGERVVAAREAGTKPNPDDLADNPTGGSFNNWMANVGRGTPLPSETLGDEKAPRDLGQAQARLKLQQATALHDIATGREIGHMGLQQSGKEALRSLAGPLATARKARGIGKK